MYRDSKFAVASHAITIISRFHWLCTHAVCDPTLHSSSVTIKGSAMLYHFCYSPSARVRIMFNTSLCCGDVVPHEEARHPRCSGTLLWPQKFSNANIYRKSRAAASVPPLFTLPSTFMYHHSCSSPHSFCSLLMLLMQKSDAIFLQL